MATRAQVIRQALYSLHTNSSDTLPWYTKEEAWTALLHVAGFSADVLRAFNQPLVAGTIDTVSGLVQRRVLSKEDAVAWLKRRLQTISLQIQSVCSENEAVLYTRLDAQLELIMELLNDYRIEHG